MTVFVADARPLIGLARIERLGLLEKLYGTIWIPPAVASELRARSARPGASSLAEALRSGWLEIHPVDAEETATLLAQLDVGEAEAILLAMHSKDALLILDDRRGRRMARKWSIRVLGLGGVLLDAKRQGYLREIGSVLDELKKSGYRLSERLCKKLLSSAGEAEDDLG